MWYEEVHDVKKFRLGTQKTAVDGRVFVYLSGAANVSAGKAVSFGSSYAAVLTDTGTASTVVGPLAIAMASVVAGKFGWFGRRGVFTASAGDVAANAAVVCATNTAGRLDDTVTNNARVAGAVWRSTDNSAANTATIQIDFPHFATDVS